MPHATNEFPFEWRILMGILGRVGPLLEIAGGEASCLLVLEAGGRFTVCVGRAIDEFRARAAELESLGTGHVLFDPLDDGREYRWLAWSHVPRNSMETWIGKELEPIDFVSTKTGGARDYPESWGVMF